MFSPSRAEGGPAMATRSRRRQRPKSSESLVRQPKLKRQRVPLSEQTFVNPEPQPEVLELKTEKTPKIDTKHPLPLDDSHPSLRKEPSVRAKKSKHSDRATNKGDGSLVLSSTNAFTVSKLPALPDRIKSDWSGNQTVEIFSQSGYTLTLTPAHAIVWPYNATTQSPETFAFTLPSASKPGDPLPVGCLVSPSASSTEPGLIVVMSGSGKIVYWQSISSAATFAFIKKDRSGVEHMISGMSSGEKAIAITNAELAGFILTFNTGRFAHVSVRDSHGRPAISVQFLRTGLTPAGGGILGSIRHAFSSLSLRGDVAAVRADRSTRISERNIAALTSNGKLQFWMIHRGGHYESTGETDMRDTIVTALQEADRMSKDFPAESFESLDFVFVPKGLEQKYLDLSRLSDAMASDDAHVHHLLLLVSLTERGSSRYALVETIWSPNKCRIGMIRPITSYSTPISRTDSVQNNKRPRVHLPRPALVAFIVFDHAAVIASVASPPESPESQLRSDSRILPASFEDVVDFREDNIHEIIGSGFEEMPAMASGLDESRTSRHKLKNPAVVLMVRSAGVVRIVTTDVDKFASDQPPRVSAKSKLEQAVFFGMKKSNPLMFDGLQDFQFTNEEIAKAALEVSHEVLSSTTPYVSMLPVSMDENLRARASALEKLMSHLKAIGANLDRKTRWSLLHDAEKMHVAVLLWKRYEAFTASRPAESKKSLVASIVDFIYADGQNPPDRSSGELDGVRYWFTHDIYRLEHFVAWAYEVIKVLYKERLIHDIEMTTELDEAMRINITACAGAVEFRKSNLTLYGLGQDQLRMGILRDGYEELPEPWTGCHFIANNAYRLTELSQQWYGNAEEARKTAQASKGPLANAMALIYNAMPAMIDVMLIAVLEYSQWRTANPDPDGKGLAQEFIKTYDKDRHDRPISLARLGKWEQGASIAEKHGCLSALAVILLEQMELLNSQVANSKLSVAEKSRLNSLRQARKTKLEDSVERYGELFAYPVYDYLLNKHGVAALLNFELDSLGFKTRFLRSRPSLARISWINDIQQEKDMMHTSDTLMNLATTGEDHLWRKKIELSLGKLSLLAEAEGRLQVQPALMVKSDEAMRSDKLNRFQCELDTVSIQERLYRQILPSIYDAVDNAAALNFALETHSANISRRQMALLQVFSDGMAKLLDHQVLDAMCLIDLLTLVDLSPESRRELSNHPFWLALKVADRACHSDETRDAKNLIWRRLFLRDDWAKLNDTQLKDDAEVRSRIVETELFSMFVDCIRHQDVREPFHYKEPQEVIGVFTESLDRRFHNLSDSEQTKLLEAMRYEDKLVLQYLEKNRLAKWVRAAWEEAQRELTGFAEALAGYGPEAGEASDPPARRHVRGASVLGAA